MKNILAFIYICLSLFAVVGGLGICFYIRQPQFGVALSILGILLGLNFFKVINLPNKDWFK